MPLIAPSVTWSTGYILAGLFACTPIEAQIDIRFNHPPPKIDNRQTQAFLNAMHARSISPDYGSAFPLVEGINSGSFQVEHAISYESAIRPLLKSACVSVKKIDITVNYDSTIYIHQDAKPGSCRYNLILGHEMKHVETDLAAMRDHLPFLRKIAAATIAGWNNKRDPIDEADIDRQQRNISAQLTTALKLATDKLQKARLLMQPKVDSPEEYERVSKACPSQMRGR